MSDRPRCVATKRNGEPCKGFALPGKDTCLAHSKTPEERRASALHAARARGVQNRAKRNEPASPFAGVHTGLTPRDVCKMLAPALTATHADSGLPDQADWETRLFALTTLLHLFPRELQTTPEHARRILAEVMPEAVQQSVERFQAERQYKEMRRALIHSRIRQNVLGQLYIAPLPEWAFAPWENPNEVMAQEAPDLRNATPIKALDGTLLLEREDEPGLVDVVTVDA